MEDLPQWLNKEAWNEWVQFRKKIKKKHFIKPILAIIQHT